MDEALQSAWTQGGAIGLLLCGMMFIIYRLYKDGQEKDKRIEAFGERVLTVAVTSTEAVRESTETKKNLIDRIDLVLANAADENHPCTVHKASPRHGHDERG